MSKIFQAIDSQQLEEPIYRQRPLQAPRDPESSRSGLLKVMRHWAELDSQLQSAIVDLIDAALEEKGGSNDKE